MTISVQDNESARQITNRAFEAYDEALRVHSKFPIRAYFDTLSNYDQETFKLQSFLEASYDAEHAGIFQSPRRDTSQVLKDLLEGYITNKLPEEEAKFDKYHDQYRDGFSVKVDNPENKFQVGPLTFTHSVQSIQIAEPKAVEEFATSRRLGSFIIPSGESKPIITVNFLFSSLEEINNSLRPLIALYRICPITVVNDKIISASLGNKSKTPRLTTIIRNQLRDLTENDGKDSYERNSITESSRKNSNYSNRYEEFFEKQKGKNNNLLGERANESLEGVANDIRRLLGFSDLSERLQAESEEFKDTSAKLIRLAEEYEQKSREDTIQGFIPVALRDLVISTHPDLPEAFVVTLTMGRISPAAYTEKGILWKNEKGEPVLNPSKAFYLKVALNRYLEKIPELTKTDFTENSIDRPVTFYTDIEILDSVERLRLDFSNEKYNSKDLKGHEGNPYRMVHVKGMQASISHHYSMPVLIGKEYPTAQHVGTTKYTLLHECVYRVGRVFRRSKCIQEKD